MKGNNARRIIRYITITILAAFGPAVPSWAQKPEPPHKIEVVRISPTQGPPDLAVRLSYGIFSTDAIVFAGVTVKATVSNQFTFVRNPVGFFGSDAKNVIVRINWGGGLSLVGKTIQGPTGFECFVGGNQDLLCVGGNIPAGGNAVFQFNLAFPEQTGPPCAPPNNAPVQATVDPYNSIAEADETNNEGSIDVPVWYGPC
jgi:hypothetical protein